MKRRIALLFGAALLGALAFARPVSAQNCDFGAEAGQWNLPHGTVDGNLDGMLTDSTGMAVYHFTATLHNHPTACLSCEFGSIDGTLVSLTGGSPLTVHGFYNGAQLTGTGLFRAQVLLPGITPPVFLGGMRGTFHQPDITQPGMFSGHWAICIFPPQRG
jgi:hypothetical protein